MNKYIQYNRLDKFQLEKLTDFYCSIFEYRRKSQRRSIKSVLVKCEHILVMDDVDIVGGISYRKHFHDVYISYLAVRDKGNGIGTKLLNLLCKYHNKSKITLDVKRTNTSAIQFYIANGFMYDFINLSNYWFEGAKYIYSYRMYYEPLHMKSLLLSDELLLKKYLIKRSINATNFSIFFTWFITIGYLLLMLIIF